MICFKVNVYSGFLSIFNKEYLEDGFFFQVLSLHPSSQTLIGPCRSASLWTVVPVGSSAGGPGAGAKRMLCVSHIDQLETEA